MDPARLSGSLAPDDARPHYHLGVALAHLGQPAEAAAALESAVALDPNWLAPHRRLAELFEGALLDPRRARQHRARMEEILLQHCAQGLNDVQDE